METYVDGWYVWKPLWMADIQDYTWAVHIAPLTLDLLVKVLYERSDLENAKHALRVHIKPQIVFHYE